MILVVLNPNGFGTGGSIEPDSLDDIGSIEPGGFGTNGSIEPDIFDTYVALGTNGDTNSRDINSLGTLDGRWLYEFYKS